MCQHHNNKATRLSNETVSSCRSPDRYVDSPLSPPPLVRCALKAEKCGSDDVAFLSIPNLDNTNTHHGMNYRLSMRRMMRKTSNKTSAKKKSNHHKIVHNYTDHSMDQEDIDLHANDRYDYQSSFPMKLHELLNYVEVEGMEDIVSWQPHGRCFLIHKKKEFVHLILPRFFRQTQLTSFQRQLNLYGFNRLTHGPDNGSYYHEYFLKGRPSLCKRMIRTKIKGTRCKGANNPEDEPNFYRMPPLTSYDNIAMPNEYGGRSPQSQLPFQYPDIHPVDSKEEIDTAPLVPDLDASNGNREKDEKCQFHRNTCLTSDTLPFTDACDDDDWTMDDEEVSWWMETGNKNCNLYAPLIDNSDHSDGYSDTSSEDDVIDSDETTLDFMLECILDE